MNTWVNLATSVTTAGDNVLLRQHKNIYEIMFNGHQLMSSINYQSEEVLALKAMRQLEEAPKRVLVAGLGLGFTTRAVLEMSEAQTEVHVCELLEEIVTWNRSFFGHLAEHPLQDERCHVHIQDIQEHLSQTLGHYDVILMDTDNGPDIVVRQGNTELYQECGIEKTLDALTPSGCAYFWSATISDAFEERLDRLACQWSREDVALIPGRVDAMHHIYKVQRQVPVKQTAH